MSDTRKKKWKKITKARLNYCIGKWHGVNGFLPEQFQKCLSELLRVNTVKIKEGCRDQKGEVEVKGKGKKRNLQGTRKSLKHSINSKMHLKNETTCWIYKEVSKIMLFYTYRIMSTYLP